MCWHPAGMQTALTRVSGGRFPCGPETTTGYLLPTLRVGQATRQEGGNLTPARTQVQPRLGGKQYTVIN